MTDIIQKMADHFDKEKLALKLAEECTELAEVLIKTVTKSEALKPPVEKIIEEMGDVFFRAQILMKKLGIETKVTERTIQKADNIAMWYKDRFEKLDN